MTRKDYVKDLIDKGLTDEEIIQAVVVGDPAKGVKPMTGKDDKAKQTFAKLIVKRIKKEIA